MKLSNVRKFNTDIHIISFGRDIRLDTTIGIPGIREDIRKVFGTPRLDEVTALRVNLSLFNTGDPKSEEIGTARGDAFINVAYDGKSLFFEPDIPPQGMIWEAPAAYRLLRNGIEDHTGEALLKSITGANPRTMLGQDQKGIIYVIISEGRKPNQKGLTANEERSVCKELNMKDAVNADGGGSSVALMYDTQIGKAWDYRPLGRIIIGYVKYDIKNLPLLTAGKKGVYVNLLQRLLKANPDGNFDAKTKNSVVEYQKIKGLKADGKVGPKTWLELMRN